jgi:hypothetical protein
MSKRHTVTIPDVIGVYNDMFDQMDSIMWPLAKWRTQWMEDLYTTACWVWHKWTIYYAEVTLTSGMPHRLAHIVDPFWKLRTFRKWDKGMDIHPDAKTLYRIQHRKAFWCMCRMNTLPNMAVCQAWNPKSYRATIPSPLQWHQDLANFPSIQIIYAVIMTNNQCSTMWLKQQPDKAIAQHSDWQLPGCIWIHRLMNHTIGGKLIQISTITTPTVQSNGDYQHIMDSGHHWLVAPTILYAPKVCQSM